MGSDILKELGYTIELAHNGREAIEMLAGDHDRFDLAILDMNMPRMGGRETLKQIRELNPSMKVVVCSGYSTTMLDGGDFAQSIDGFIQKPYELAEFARKIRSALDKRRDGPPG